MYDQSKLSELIRFARVDAGFTVIDVYPGDGDWTRLFSDIVGPEGRVYSFAGFVLDAESTMLANKDDPHSIKVFDPSIKGETDRFAYRFVKP